MGEKNMTVDEAGWPDFTLWLKNSEKSYLTSWVSQVYLAR